MLELDKPLSQFCVMTARLFYRACTHVTDLHIERLRGRHRPQQKRRQGERGTSFMGRRPIRLDRSDQPPLCQKRLIYEAVRLN